MMFPEWKGLVNKKLLNYFKGQYLLLLQYEILEKLVTFMDSSLEYCWEISNPNETKQN